MLAQRPADHHVALLHRTVAGRPVLVTGASSGIGAATALRLGAAGATVLLLARRTEHLEDVAAQIRATGGRAAVFPCDLADPQQVGATAALILAGHPALWAVVSNAGRSVRRTALAGAARQDVARLLAVNFSGPAGLLLALAPALAANAGVVVNVSSVSARHVGAPRWSAYQGSKAGFDLWLRAAATEWPRVRVASVYMPLVHTPMSAPTRAYRWLPALTPSRAAAVVLRPLIRPVTRVAPWWLRPVELAGLLAPHRLAHTLSALERLEARRERRP